MNWRKNADVFACSQSSLFRSTCHRNLTLYLPFPSFLVCDRPAWYFLQMCYTQKKDFFKTVFIFILFVTAFEASQARVHRKPSSKGSPYIWTRSLPVDFS